MKSGIAKKALALVGLFGSGAANAHMSPIAHRHDAVSDLFSAMWVLWLAVFILFAALALRVYRSR